MQKCWLPYYTCVSDSTRAELRFWPQINYNFSTSNKCVKLVICTYFVVVGVVVFDACNKGAASELCMEP